MSVRIAAYITLQNLREYAITRFVNTDGKPTDANDSKRSMYEKVKQLYNSKYCKFEMFVFIKQ